MGFFYQLRQPRQTSMMDSGFKSETMSFFYHHR